METETTTRPAAWCHGIEEALSMCYGCNNEKLFNETDVFNTYEYVRKHCFHFCEYFTYHVLYLFYHKSGCSCGLEKDLK